MSPDERGIIICVRADSMPTCHPGSAIRKCKKCAHDVIVTPTTLAFLAQRDDVGLLCLVCVGGVEAAIKLATEANKIFVFGTPGPGRVPNPRFAGKN